jgi:hypothetical protein
MCQKSPIGILARNGPAAGQAHGLDARESGLPQPLPQCLPFKCLMPVHLGPVPQPLPPRAFITVHLHAGGPAARIPLRTPKRHPIFPAKSIAARAKVLL